GSRKTELVEIHATNPRFHLLFIPGNPGFIRALRCQTFGAKLKKWCHVSKKGVCTRNAMAPEFTIQWHWFGTRILVP
ncbi:hypothetical protein Tco_0570532, partial [Tanacetum coccineum]